MYPTTHNTYIGCQVLVHIHPTLLKDLQEPDNTCLQELEALTRRHCHTHEWIWIREGKNQRDLVVFTCRDRELDHGEDSGDLRENPVSLQETNERERELRPGTSPGDLEQV